MKKLKINLLIIGIGILAINSCNKIDDFLDKAPLAAPSLETFWTSESEAEMWVNNLYNDLCLDQLEGDIRFEAYSDNAVGRAGMGANSIANGLFTPFDGRVGAHWDYSKIRLCLDFFENITRVPDISQIRLDELSGQVRFMLAYHYHNLITLYRDVPLVTKPLRVDDSDMAKSPKAEVLNYILGQLNLAIDELPLEWPVSETGRITKGAALTLKARVLLYNERWAEAAETAKAVMDLDIYELHPEFDELFRAEFNNSTKEVILAKQYVENVREHQINTRYGPAAQRGQALIVPTPELAESFEMIDGLSIWESPLYDPVYPFDNRDPRFRHTFLVHGDDLNGRMINAAGERNRLLCYFGFHKYIADLKDGYRPGWNNFTIFRYADVLLMYAEAKNEATGPDNSIYDALDLIRERAGMPPVDRDRYNDKASLREFIRNERRVELAGEGLRYYDILRWRIAENTLNIDVYSLDPELWHNRPEISEGNPLMQVLVQSRTFDPSRHYVWPIPQYAIDRSAKLEQHPEWR